MGWMITVAVAVAVAAALRSTWSPCGLSMLSTITPLSERGRGHRYGVTAAWFVVGATAGGATLGAVGLLLAFGVGGLGVSTNVALALGGAAALIAAGADGGILGVRFPVFRRQVNEQWLDSYRPWFYGAGFGWQVGAGVATYIMTAGVFLTVVLAALTASPLAALSICATFGFVRGLTVFLTRSLRTSESLRAFHRRFDRLAQPVRMATTAVEALGAAVLLSALWAPAGGALAALLVVVVASRVRRRRSPAPVGKAA